MRTCVVKLCNKLMYSLIDDGVLIFHKQIEDVSELTDLLYKMEIDKLTILCQATPVSDKTDDSYKISTHNLYGRYVPFVLRDKDVYYFIELANTIGIAEINIHCYLDYLKHKYNKHSKIVAVSNYISDYAVYYFKEGEIIDFRKSSRVNLIRDIGKFKNKYTTNVDSVDSTVNTLELREVLKNYSLIEKKYLHTLDHIPYCLNSRGLELSSKEHDLDSWDDYEPDNKEVETGEEDEFDSDIFNDEALSESPRQVKKARYNSEINDEFEEIESGKLETKDKLMNIVVFVAIMLLFTLMLGGLFATFAMKSRAQKTLTLIELNQDKLKLVDDMQDYCNGDISKSPSIKLWTLYDSTHDLKSSNYSYEFGETSVTLLSQTDIEKNSNEEAINKSFSIKESSFMGNYKENETTYNKTKYLVNLRGTSP